MGVWKYQRSNESVSQIQKDLAERRILLNERKAMMEEMTAHPVKIPDQNEVLQLENERREMIRLRGELTRYSTTKNQTLEALDDKIAATKAKAQAIRWESNLMSSMEIARDERKMDRNVMHTIHHLWIFYINERQKIPLSLEEVIQWIDSLPGQPAEKSVAENLSVGNTFRSTTWKDFELLDTGRSDSEGNPLSVLREKEPRTLPDDSVSRFYILHSGQFHEVLASSREFREVESGFLSGLAD